jgi:hypothetical protein
MPYYAAIQNPLFIPASRDVVAITQANPAVVTTSFDHGYLSQWIVRIVVPNGFGMTNLNDLTFPITVLSPTTFSIPINTSGFTAFSVPTSPKFGTPAQCIPIGEEAALLSGSFRNVFERPNP